jgi:hypothetical protein
MRDLGGVPVAGGTFVHGRVFRSDTIMGLTDDDVATLIGTLSIRTVLDLRTADEMAHGVSELIAAGATYRHHPIGRRLGSIRRRGSSEVTMAEGYMAMFETSVDSIRSAVHTIAESDSLPIVFHCAGGKDRAGLMAASLLSALGSTPDTVAGEYALTAERFAAVMDRLLADPQYADVMQRVDPESLTAEPEVMLEFLEAVSQRWGSVSDALELEPETVERLRAVLVE